MVQSTVRKLEVVQQQQESVPNTEKFPLFWYDIDKGKKYPAGVGFHIPRFGEYLLKIDSPAESKPVYLKATSQDNDIVKFRVEVPVKRRDGKFSHRVEIGTGYTDGNAGGMIWMDLGYCCRKLVLDLNV